MSIKRRQNRSITVFLLPCILENFIWVVIRSKWNSENGCENRMWQFELKQSLILSIEISAHNKSQFEEKASQMVQKWLSNLIEYKF